LIFWQQPDRSPAASWREFIDRMAARALFNAGTCVFLEIWTGKKIAFFCPFRYRW